ncbi:MAG: alkaline phosphatase [Wenzhouxiangellaceae bacterium]
MVNRLGWFGGALLCWLVCGMVRADTVVQECTLVPAKKGAVFFHPDGTSAGHWDAMRLLYYGPDGRSHWDRMPRMAAYRGHLTDRMSATSNAGASIHATGTRTWSGAFGRDEQGAKLRAADGTDRTIMEQAVICGLGTALVQTGTLVEPGTAAFVANAGNRYRDAESIALQVIESGVDILLGAGEEWLLPSGMQGHFGPGRRTDGRNLIDEARKRGYAVVYTRAELLALDPDVDKVLGVFALEDTYNDLPEESLKEHGLPFYDEQAPTVAEMTAFALERIARNPNGYFAVVEEEGTDNFCNRQNAAGCLTALKRADEAVAYLLDFVEAHPEAFVLMASDSNAGGMQISEVESADQPVPEREARTGALLDGREGTATLPFLSAADRHGRRFPFAIAWAVGDDVGSGVIVRAAGHDAARLLPGTTLVNTEVYRILYRQLFGRWIDADAELQPQRR